MRSPQYKLRAKLWKWSGKDAWHFLTLPKNESKEIRGLFGDLKRGFGSLRVRVTIGATSWDTSIFPSAKDKAYLLPVKASVRKAEGLKSGATVAFTMQLQDL